MERKGIVLLVSSEIDFTCLKVDIDCHLRIDLFFAFLLSVEHHFGVITLFLVHPVVLGEFVPICCLIDHAQPLRGINVVFNQLVSMLQRFLILTCKCFVLSVITKLSEIYHRLSVDPSSTEEARTLTFLLAHDLARIDAIVH